MKYFNLTYVVGPNGVAESAAILWLAAVFTIGTPIVRARADFFSYVRCEVSTGYDSNNTYTIISAYDPPYELDDSEKTTDPGVTVTREVTLDLPAGSAYAYLNRFVVSNQFAYRARLRGGAPSPDPYVDHGGPDSSFVFAEDVVLEYLSDSPTDMPPRSISFSWNWHVQGTYTARYSGSALEATFNTYFGQVLPPGSGPISLEWTNTWNVSLDTVFKLTRTILLNAALGEAYDVTLWPSGLVDIVDNATGNPIPTQKIAIYAVSTNGTMSGWGLTPWPWTNHPPVVQIPMTDQSATVGVPFSFTLLTNTFVDPDPGDTLTFFASGLPPGITFDSSSGTFSGTPTTSGTFPVTLTATDNGSPPLSASTSFNIVVSTSPSDVTFQFQTTMDATAFGGVAATPLIVTYTFDSTLANGSGPFSSSPTSGSYGPLRMQIQLGSETVLGFGGGIYLWHDVGGTDGYDVRPGTINGTLLGRTVTFFRFLLVGASSAMFSSTDLPLSPAFATAATFQQTELDFADGTMLAVNEFPNTPPAQLTPFTLTLLSPQRPLISWPQPGNLTYPAPLTAQQLNATANVPGTFVYSPPARTMLNSGPGQVLRVTFTPTDVANYSIVTATTTITVDPGYSVLTWPDPADIIYSTTLGSLQLNATAAGNVYGTPVAGTFTYTPPAGTTLNAGLNQQLRVDFTPTDTNYLANGTLAHINVLKATPVIIWPTPNDFVYGLALSSAQLNASASVRGTFTYAPPAGTVLGAGSNQVLTVTFTPADSADYNTVSNTVTVNVLKRDLTVTAGNGSRLYGGLNPSVAVSIVGPRAGDDFLANTTIPATPTSPVGTYSIVPSLVDVSGALSNYNATYINGTLTVTPAPLAVNVNNQSKAYGAPLPALTGTLVGILNGDTITANYFAAATQSSPVGTYDIGATLNDPGMKLGNYIVVINKGSLSVTPVSLVITANNQTKVYGSANPALPISYSGFVNGDTAASLTSQPVANTTVLLGSPVGTYPITVGGAASPNYIITYTNGVLTVNPAPLKVTSADAGKQYSDPLPSFSATYKGFVLSDGPSSLSGTLAFSTAATMFSATGSYKISCSGLSSPNYTITFATGTLTVNTEDARTTYTGPTAAKTTSPSKGNFSVTLTTSINDITAVPTDPAWDPYPGNITNAIVAFVDRSTGTTLVGNIPVKLVGPGTTNGVASAVWTGSIGSLTSKTYTIGTVVTGYYTRNSASENAMVTISR